MYALVSPGYTVQERESRERDGAVPFHSGLWYLDGVRGGIIV